MVWLAGGLSLVALSGYLFMLLVGRLGTGERPAALTSYYFLVTTVLLGVCAGLDQVTNRRIARTIALGLPLRPAIKLAIRDAVGLAVCTAAVLLATTPIVLPRSLHGDLMLFSALFVGIPMATFAYLVRGVLAGAQRFRAYAATWAAEGLSRMAMVSLLFTHKSAPAWVYGYVYVGAFGFSAVVGVFACRHLNTTAVDTPAPQETGTRSGLVSLAGAGLLTLGIANLPLLVLGSRLVSDTAAVTAFGQIFLLARISLTALAPFQAMLLPMFTRSATHGDIPGLRSRLRLAILVCAIGTTIWTAVVIAAGPWVLRVVFTTTTTPSRLTFTALGVGTILLSLAGALQPALVAMSRYQWVPLSWGAGAAVTAVIATWPWVAPITAATLAGLIGPAIVLVTMGFAARNALALGSAGQGSLAEAAGGGLSAVGVEQLAIDPTARK